MLRVQVDPKAWYEHSHGLMPPFWYEYTRSAIYTNALRQCLKDEGLNPNIQVSFRWGGQVWTNAGLFISTRHSDAEGAVRAASNAFRVFLLNLPYRDEMQVCAP